MSKQFNIEQFNEILKEYNQQLQAEKITGREVVLSNGLVLNSEKDVRLCKRRVMRGDKVWKENFDRIYSIDTEQRASAEKECRSLTSVKGGVNCQKEHKEQIKSNLNIGTPWNKGMKGNYPYSHPCSENAKKRIGDANRGKKNGMFGRTHSEEYKNELSKKIKKLILLGKFTPNSNNRNTHWDSFYQNKKYRSSWEALYQYFDNDAEYETLRITYKFNNKDYIYIVDFVNHKTKIVVEVKPRELINNEKTKAKISAAKGWCFRYGYTFVLADKDYLISQPMPDNLTEFDIKTQNKIRKLYEAG
jgi:very-short-patch-repair endonuclease